LLPSDFLPFNSPVSIICLISLAGPVTQRLPSPSENNFPPQNNHI
jgi:hypothetical protein